VYTRAGFSWWEAWGLPNWLIPDPTGIESVFIDFEVLY